MDFNKIKVIKLDERSIMIMLKLRAETKIGQGRIMISPPGAHSK